MFHSFNFVTFHLSLGMVIPSRRMLKEFGLPPDLDKRKRKTGAWSRTLERIFGGMELMLSGRHFGVEGRDAERYYLSFPHIIQCKPLSLNSWDKLYEMYIIHLFMVELGIFFWDCGRVLNLAS